MEKSSSQTSNVGFWMRFLATWIDFLLVYTVLKIFFYILFFSSLYIYFPFEFAFFILFILYSITFIASAGQTVGKWLLNIKVVGKNGERLSVIKSVLRESVLKILSGAVLFLGFFWIGFSKNKKGWHDYLIGSKIIRNNESTKRVLFWRSIAVLSFVIIAGNYVGEISTIIYSANRMVVTKRLVDLPFMHRKPSEVIEVSKITNDTLFTNWLNKHAQSAESYAIDMAKTHQVTLFGEVHDSKDNLQFFGSIINDLYYKAGVRCIAMEVIPASMNGEIEKLIDAKEYDDELAMEIARSQGWKSWGDKEYWDVLKTVWKLNKGLPANAHKMRLVGIDDDWEMANIVLLNTGGDKRGPTPFTEKFRVLPAIKDIINGSYRDEIMARNIEKEIIEKNDKGVVWVGFAHTMLQYGWPIIQNHKVVLIKQRLGLLLSQKYKNKIFQIELFQSFYPEIDNTVHPPVLRSFIETVMEKRNSAPTGFSILNSPFANIRDSYSDYFNTNPSICYEDIAQGLIFIKPINEIKHCTWTEGYISNEMFMNYKPLYDLIATRKFANAKDVNGYFAKRYLDGN
jgi:uncharacterized RDD family membrane protein YckC